MAVSLAIYSLTVSGSCLDRITSLLALNPSAISSKIASATLIVTAIREVKGITLVKVYPNPANAKLNVNVELSDAQDIKVEIFNSIGQHMWSKEYQNYQTLAETIDISAFAQGVYMVRIKANENVKTIRVVKE